LNKIILAILIGIAISSLTYGALNAPAVDVQLLFLGFFTGKDMFGTMGSNFDCTCINQFPGSPSTATCQTDADIVDPALEKYAIDESGTNICT